MQRDGRGRRWQQAAGVTRGVSAIATAVALMSATASAATVPLPALGVYTGPGPKGISRAADFDQWSGRKVAQILDFPPTATWSDITNPSWLLEPHRHAEPRLVLSLPLLPDNPDTTLTRCAGGDYNKQWAALARNLMTYRLSDTTLRPGWEFNGTWYRWAALNAEEDFAECFRQVVQTMRTIPGQKFTFDWNPNLGPGTFPAERAYPGDAYVDFVGLDVYDLSWTVYPVPVGMTTSQARQHAWENILAGDHGLNFWEEFAQSRNKPLSIPEWAVTWRSDGHGGGDNQEFVNNMLDFIENPANQVKYANYFNSRDNPNLAHDIRKTDTRFPESAAEFLRRMRSWPN
jgi:hypothetical protein